jgi:apolipoprotein N-acyltransferase
LLDGRGSFDDAGVAAQRAAGVSRPARLGGDAAVSDARASRWRRSAAATASGLLLALAFPLIDWNPLAWVALVPLLWAALGRGAAHALVTGWIAGSVFFVATLYWLALTIGTYTNLSPLLSIGPVLLLCCFLGFFFAVFAAGCELARRSRVELTLVGPPLWVVLEWVRTYILGGFPWVSLGYTQYRTTYLIQFAEFTGVYGVSALVVLVNVVIYGAFRRWRDGQVPGTRGMLALAGLLTMLALWGFWRVRALEAAVPAGSLRVGFVQGNVPQDVKWDPAYQDTTLDRYEELTGRAVAEGAELVVWPETAAPFFFQEESPLRDRVMAIVHRYRVWLLVGSPAFSYESGGVALHNRAYLVTPDGSAERYYDKMELVPFGEYVPLARLLSFVHKVVEGIGEFRAGTDPVVFPTAHGATFGTLICYEGIFPGLARRFVAGGADFLVNITNDAWFGRTAAPYQHLAMVTVRAVENRVPIVRVANTGFSAMVETDGRIRWRTDLFETAWRVDTIRWTGEPTLYTRAGDVFVYACMVILAVVALIATIRPHDISREGRQPV